MFARINHELAERESLEQERQGLLKKKQGLIADNKKRKDDLASLDRELEGFIDVSALGVCLLSGRGFRERGTEGRGGRKVHVCANELLCHRQQNRYRRFSRSSIKGMQRGLVST